jgi:hypothetical protein
VTESGYRKRAEPLTRRDPSRAAVASAAFKNVRVPLGDGRATVRYFKPEHGTMRVYQFGKVENSEVTEGALLKQLRASGIAARPNPFFNPQASPPRK